MLAHDREISLSALSMQNDLHGARRIADLICEDNVTFSLLAGKDNVWVVGSVAGADVLALRSGFGATISCEPVVSVFSGGRVCEWSTPLGAMRLKISFPPSGKCHIHCRLSFLPAEDVRLAPLPRDLFLPPDIQGSVHTTQRGLRTGIFFASVKAPISFSVFYLQDFSALNEFFELTGTSPAGTVGGDLGEAGYLPPITENTTLPKSREVVVSDVHLAFVADAPDEDHKIGGRYLDLLADVYLDLERPDTAYHNWPAKAEKTLRDLVLSPACTYERKGSRYLRPYVSDNTKPPESMVQLTVLMNMLEYDTWRDKKSAFTRTQLEGIERFYNPEVESVVRWLPGEEFGEQSEENMNHECMDSWYLYHSLFNVSRLAALGHEPSRTMFRNSLPFAMRVARRFNYIWPIFFHLKTLDIVRAESAPGKGGENDVAGLYALVMLHAYELFEDVEYLDEAKKAAGALRRRGFDIGYQMNTTGFAAEAMLRLWKLTQDDMYLSLSEMCMANIFDNMWLWKCEYGHAYNYRTFFGLFPLHDAPYLAAYEELECQAKFHVFLALGGTDLRPSLRLLLAEYQKYSLDRGWFYYPDALPTNVTSKEVRNGTVERELAIPLEDMQDGRSLCGQVGQEIYGAGLAFIYVSRHYTLMKNANVLAFCEYPIYDFLAVARGKKQSVIFRTGGDLRGECRLRLIPIDVEKGRAEVSIRAVQKGTKSSLSAATTVEGHSIFLLKGDCKYELQTELIS